MSGKIFYTCYIDLWIIDKEWTTKIRTIKNSLEKLGNKHNWAADVFILMAGKYGQEEFTAGHVIMLFDTEVSESKLHLITDRLEKTLKSNFAEFSIGTSVVVTRETPLLIYQLKEFAGLEASLWNH